MKETYIPSIFIVNSNNKTQITVLSTDNNKVDVTNYAVICNQHANYMLNSVVTVTKPILSSDKCAVASTVTSSYAGANKS